MKIASDVSPDEIRDLLLSEGFRTEVGVLTKHWGAEHLTEHTLSAFIFSTVVREIYYNEKRGAKLSRPFVLEHREELESECEICGKTNVRSDLALIERDGGVLLWIEIKRLDHGNQIVESTLDGYKCDIEHSSHFENNLSIIFCQSKANLGGYMPELQEFAESKNVNHCVIVIEG